MRLFTLLALLMAIVGGASAADLPAPRYLYAANMRSNNVSGWRIESSGTLTPVEGSPFAVGRKPSAVCADPLGRGVYVANAADGTVSTFTAGSGGTLRPAPGSPCPAGTAPQALAMDASYLYVANGVQGDAITVFRIDESGRLIPNGSTALPRRTAPSAMDVNQGGDQLAVAGYLSQQVSLFRIDAGTLSSSMEPGGGAVGPYPQSVSYHPTGRFLYACGSNPQGVSAFAVAGDMLEPLAGSPFRAGPQPSSIALSYTGRWAWVSDFSTGDIIGYAVDSDGGTLGVLPGYPMDTGDSLRCLRAEPTGRYLYAADSVSSKIRAYRIDDSTGSLTLVDTEPADDGPVSLDVLIR